MLFLLIQPTYVLLPGPGNSFTVHPQSASPYRLLTGTCQYCLTNSVFMSKVAIAAVIGMRCVLSIEPVVTMTVLVARSMVGTFQMPPPRLPSATILACAAMLPSVLLSAYSILWVSGFSQSEATPT